MADLQTLFDAHYPDRSYLTELCDHYYCGFLSVAVLRRTREKTVRPFAHRHEAYEFLLPLTPAPQIMQGDEVYFGRVGYAYPVQSGCRHAQAVELCDVSNCSIVVDREYFEKRLAEKGLAGAQVGRIFAVSETLKDYLRLFEQEFSKREAADPADLNALGGLIVSALIEDHFHPAALPPLPDTASVMEEIESYIDQHFCEKITLEELVARSGFTRSYFTALFKKRCGEAPYTRITRLRLAKAKVLLRSTPYPVAKIAALCGFSSSNAFANVFRRDTGKTPGEFRKI